MKVFRIILWCLLGCILIPIILAVLAFVIFFLSTNRYGPPIHQSQEEIIRIELLDTHAYEETELAPHTYEEMVLYTLEESEHHAFMEELDSIKFHKRFSGPWPVYGSLAVKITYRNGWSDVLGMDVNYYCTPEGEATDLGAWYSLVKEKDFFELFSEYVDSALLPQE